MTARSGVIDGPVTGDAPPWRVTWARHEDGRRQQVYDETTSIWSRHHEHLIRLRIEAAGFQGYLPARGGLPVELEDDEVIYRIVPEVRLVEVPARHARGLPVPGVSIGAPSGEEGWRSPRGLRVVGAGTVLVTDRRVTFVGSGAGHEWRYAQVTGLAHHAGTPLSLLHSTDGRRLVGLLVPAAAMLNFRFYLTLAFAAATGRREDIIAEVDALLAAHEAARPVPPPPARPAEAPLSALRPDRRVGTAVAVAVIVAALSTGAVGSPTADPPYRAGTGAPGPVAAGPSGPVVGAAPPGPPRNGVTASPSAAPDQALPGSAPVGPPVTPGAAGSAAPATDGGPGSVSTVRPVRTVGPTPTVAPPPRTAPPPGSAPSPTAAPRPSSTPEPDGSALITVCLEDISLPLVNPLLCPAARP